MKFGYFDDAKREYVITTPYTPYPWINYLGLEDYFVLFSNTAGGYSFYKDARARRVTRFRYNNSPIDHEGKYFYIKELDTIWNIGVRPMDTKVEDYKCHVGLSYTKIESRKNGLYASQLAFVPKGFKGEIHQITLKNETKQAKTLQLFSYVEFALWDAHDDTTNFQRNFSIGEVEVEDGVIYHKTEFRERRDHYAFFACNKKIDAFDTDRDSIIGLYNSTSNPKAILEGQLTNSIADGWAPVGAHQINLTLEPNQTETYIFMLGYVEEKNQKFDSMNVINKQGAKAMLKQFKFDHQVEAALAEIAKFWDEKLSVYHIESEDEKLNRMVNIWNPYQTMTTYNLSRSASYFESGVGRGMGFRDSNQDLLGFMHMDYAKTKTRILDLASTLLKDGGAYHQYSPLTKKGNADIGGGFNDDPNWLILSTVQYVKETGDYSILDEVIPYESNPNLTGTLLEHLDKCFRKVVDHKGPHGLPLIGRADWNDCLNLNCFSDEPGQSFQTTENKGDGKVAESIFIGGLLVYVGRPYVELLKRLGKIEEAEHKLKDINEIEKAVLDHGYDGNWFLRAYDAFGNKVGSHENSEGQIFIEPQGMCVMAKIGIEDHKALRALNSAQALLDTKYGMVLNYPAYKTYRLELGEISSYPPGYKENGGIFCHNNPWVMCAEATLGRGDRAFEIYSKIAPAYLEDISEVHKTEPYVYSQMIAGKEAKRHGEAKNSWLTGTSAWNYVAVSQYILGIHPDFDGLRIEPVLPSFMNELKITRKYRENTYHIHMKRSSNKGVFVSGQLQPNNIITYKKSSSPIDVTVCL